MKRGYLHEVHYISQMEMALLLVKVGFLNITIWDLFDILIVGYLIFQIYKLLKGSLGFSIFLGVVFLYSLWWLVRALDMPLLSSILRQFIDVGMIALIVVFQPEVRRFLLFLGQDTLRRRMHFINTLFKRDLQVSQDKERVIRAITKATAAMAATKTGALMVFSDNSNMEALYSSGVVLNADISTQLILSIFNKESPLHDGAAILSDSKVYAASCVLPVSDSPHIPQSAGLRHRAAVGITEGTDVVTFIVSEETGQISYARNGRLTRDISVEWMDTFLRKILDKTLGPKERFTPPPSH